MTQDELKHIIELLEKHGESDNAQFTYSANNHGDTHIEATKEGLEGLALILLKAAYETPLAIEEERNISLPQKEWLGEGFDWIEILERKRTEGPKEPPPQTLWEKLIPAGCLVVVALIVLFIILGIGTAIQWFQR